VYSDSLNFRTSLPAGSGYRTSSESHIFVYLCMHQIYYHLLIMGIFMLFDCILVLIHEIWLTFIFYISSRLLYFHARTVLYMILGS
jgi:hypothetical protein